MKMGNALATFLAIGIVSVVPSLAAEPITAQPLPLRHASGRPLSVVLAVPTQPIPLKSIPQLDDGVSGVNYSGIVIYHWLF
jgi:hypothetical protein